ncbi:MAG TPA: hypothetical protein VH437_20385 [Terriglobales bacterium]
MRRLDAKIPTSRFSLFLFTQQLANVVDCSQDQNQSTAYNPYEEHRLDYADGNHHDERTSAFTSKIQFIKKVIKKA